MDVTRRIPIPASIVASALILLGALGVGVALDQSVLGAAGPAVEPSLFASLRWRFIGPTRGGIAQAVAGDPSSPYVFYQGTGGGGVWKTDDAGLTWRNISDGSFKTGSIGAIAVARSNPSVVYAGTGESCMRNTTSPGEGVYRSDDGGRTWTHLGLEKTEHIARIQIHPQNPDLVYVAAFGDAFAPNPDRGVYRSKDGGKSWEKVLYKTEGIGAIDLAMVPSEPTTVYAATWEARNHPWGNRTGGPGSGIYKTTDGGDTWSDITNTPGLPKGIKGRIGIDVSASKPGRVWALMTAEGEGPGAWPPKGMDVPAGWRPCRDYVCAGNGLYRSDDGGASWELINHDLNFFSRPWYYTHVTADPKDADTVYILVDGVFKSSDGGKTVTNFRSGDTHDMWLDPNNTRRIINATDQGAVITLNGGQTWSSDNNQPTAKFYRVTTDDRFPYRVYGGQQDGPTQSVPSRPDLGLPATYASGGGENAVVAVHPNDPDISYGGDHHWVSRHDRRTGQRRWVSPTPENNYGTAPKQMKYRFAWSFPVHVSHHDPNVLYVGAQILFRSSNEGQSWEVISPDLTLHDPATMEDTLPSDPGEYFGPITRENLTQWYSALISFSESKVRRGVMWTGSDDGLIHVSRDDGKTWENVTPKEIQPHTHISTVEASPHDPATAYVAATRYQHADDTPYLYKTNDYGKTWTRIVNGIPGNDYTRTIREDPVRRGLLYAGTERGGVYVSFDAGASWQSLRLNLPVVPVWDLGIKDNDLIAATHGRGYWILDDVTVLRQLHADPAARNMRLFQPATTVRFRGAGGRGEGARLSGAVIHYSFREKPQEEVRLTILDAQGNIAQSFSSKEQPDATKSDVLTPRPPRQPRVPAEAGANVFIWNLRCPGIRKIPTALLRRGDPEGPLAVPGNYQVRLTVGAETQTQTFEVVKDPRYDTSQAGFQEQFSLSIRIQEKVNEAYLAVAEIRNIRNQVVAITKNLKGTSGDVRRLQAAADALNKKLWSIEDVLIQFRVETDPPAAQSLIAWPVRLNDKLSTLLGFVQAADARPTDQDHELFKNLSARVGEQIAQLDELARTDLVAFNRLTRGQKQPEVVLKYTSAPTSQ